MTLNRLAGNMSRYMLRQKIIMDDKLEIYAYGLEILFATILNGVLVFSASLLLDVFLETVLMIVPFMVIRSKAGVFHAKTHWGCVAGFLGVYLTDVMALKYFEPLSNPVVETTLLFAAATAIIVIGAIPHKNRRVTDNEFTRFKRVARILTLFLTAVGLAGICVIPRLFKFYTHGILIAACSLMIAWAVNSNLERRNDYDNI